MSGGWNPMVGRDAGGGRPSPIGAPGWAQHPLMAGPGGGGSYVYGGGAYYPTLSSIYGASAPMYQWPGQPGTSVRQPQPAPVVDATMPSVQMSNTTGGVGCEPGYNYFFPQEHTKCHVYHSTTPPWQLPAGAVMQFKAAHIPCGVSLGELLRGFGCDNANPKMNRCYEIVQGGNGVWYKGISFNGGDKDMTKKTMKDVGWDKTRTGNPGEKPVVNLWFCKS